MNFLAFLSIEIDCRSNEMSFYRFFSGFFSLFLPRSFSFCLWTKFVLDFVVSETQSHTKLAIIQFEFIEWRQLDADSNCLASSTAFWWAQITIYAMGFLFNHFDWIFRVPLRFLAFLYFTQHQTRLRNFVCRRIWIEIQMPTHTQTECLKCVGKC